MMKTYIIKGRPITKKNSMQRTKHGLIQSKQYREYEESALWQLMPQRPPTPIDCAVCLTARYYMPDRRGWPDLFGLIQATADILEKAGIVEDDGFIADVDGSMIVGIDHDNPRVEITLGEITDLDFPAYWLHPKLVKRVESGQFERFKEVR